MGLLGVRLGDDVILSSSADVIGDVTQGGNFFGDRGECFGDRGECFGDVFFASRIQLASSTILRFGDFGSSEIYLGDVTLGRRLVE